MTFFDDLPILIRIVLLISSALILVVGDRSVLADGEIPARPAGPRLTRRAQRLHDLSRNRKALRQAALNAIPYAISPSSIPGVRIHTHKCVYIGQFPDFMSVNSSREPRFRVIRPVDSKPLLIPFAQPKAP